MPSRTILALLGVVLCTAVAHAAPPLQALARTVGAGQGVYAVAGDGTVLVAQAADKAVHPASVTKIATSLALLARLGAAYRFETRVRGAGPIEGRRLAGDLIVEGSGDPFFVDESALLLLRRLGARGLRTIAGDLVVHGTLLLDWQPDPYGQRLEGVLAGKAGKAAWAALGAAPDGARTLHDAALVFEHRGPRGDAGEMLAIHQSPPLLHVVKVLSGYSNNVFHYAADAIGGVAVVQELARARVASQLRDEIVIENGAGAGTTNRLSPRAVVALLDALAAELARSGHDLTAALPVSGLDPGTLQDRFSEHRGIVVGKTGTSGSVGACALAGALTTRRRGVVRFAVLNAGVPVPEARARQDAFIRALITATDAEPWPYTTPARPAYVGSEVE